MKNKLLKLMLAALIIIGAAAIKISGIGFADIKNFIEGFGALSWIVFIIVYGVATVFLMPGTIMTVIGGILFGPLAGTIINTVGATIGASASFITGRVLGQSAVQKHIGKNLRKLEDFVERNEWESILVLRLIPVFPFNVINYGLGVTKMRTSTYIIGSFIGMLPGTFVYTFAAHRVGSLLLEKGITSLGWADIKTLVLPAIMFSLLIIGGIIYKHYGRKRHSDNNTRLQRRKKP